MRTNLCLLVVLPLTVGCAQYRGASWASQWAPVAGSVDQPQNPPTPPREQRPAPRPGRPYGDTRVRLQFFREELEFDEVDVDYDDGPEADLSDFERDRFGFRAEFGSRGVGGFVQVFGEELRSPALLGEEFDLFGVGGGVAGAPEVGHAGPVEFVVPLSFAVNIAGGSETVGGFDADLLYLESAFEVGFGARAFGVQGSSGIVVDSLAGLYESDDPARLSSDDTQLTGTNVGVYFEGLYKHDRVPLMARARVVLGDVQGFLLTFGFAF